MRKKRAGKKLLIHFNMNIFIIGNSKSGKSTLSSLMASDLGYKVVSAGGWVREAFADKTPSRKEMDDYSCETFKHNPNACIEYIMEQIGNESNVIIEGIRNPRDFMFLYQPEDIVIFIKLNPIVEESDFETKGINAIQAYLEFISLTSEINKTDMIIDTSVDGDTVKYAATMEQVYNGIKFRFNGLFSTETN